MRLTKHFAIAFHLLQVVIMTSSSFSISSQTVVMTTEMHSGGEPVRIVDLCAGACQLVIDGQTLLDKRRYVTQHLDALRKFLMWEPRGHHDMYGALLVQPDHPGERSHAAYVINYRLLLTIRKIWRAVDLKLCSK